MIVTITMPKGGVAKSTSAAALGDGLARRGYKVLLIDLDKQCDLTKIIGGPRDHSQNSYVMVRRELQPEPVELKENLFLIPSIPELVGAEVELINQTAREHILRECLEPFVETFDIVLIDTPPNLGMLTANAMTAADYLLIPVKSEYLAVDATNDLFKTIATIKKYTNPKLEIAGAFMTIVEPNRNIDNAMSELASDIFGDKTFASRIRKAAAAVEAGACNVPLSDYNPRCTAHVDYENLTDEIVERLLKK